jgi:hypothetical protein
MMDEILEEDGRTVCRDSGSRGEGQILGGSRIGVPLFDVSWIAYGVRNRRENLGNRM